MIWRSVIFFSVPALWAGDVRGRVELVDSRAPAVTRQLDYSGVAVWLETAGAKPLPAAHGPVTDSSGAIMVHKNKTFRPHILAVAVGSRVSFPNRDPVFHNAFSNYDGQLFDIGLHPPGTAREVVFRRPGIVRVFCNIHPTMSAVIVVLNTPYFAVTDAKGAFAIRGVPPGDYQLHVFHERSRPERLQELSRSLVVNEAELALPLLRISEEGFIPAPHKNKHGQDYPAVIEDRYPGGVK